jgi:hypothetical protein
MQLDDSEVERNAPPDLVIDSLLLPAWASLRLDGVKLLGLAGEVSEESQRAAVVIVTNPPLAPAAAGYLEGELADLLGVPTELVPLSDPDGGLPGLLGQWLTRAAGGAGRDMQSDIRVPPGSLPIQVSVRAGAASGASAQELALRLASPREPALAALETLLDGRPVIVVDQPRSRT